MIKFEKSYINEFKNKIIFAPNGFGKTTLSKNIKKYYNDSGEEQALLFTRREMDNLLNINANTFFFGETSKQRADNSRIELDLKKTNTLKTFVKSTYGVTTAQGLREKSLFFSSVGIKNLRDESFLNIIRGDNSSIVTKKDETIMLDKILLASLYNSIPSDITGIKEKKTYKWKTKITDELFDYLSALKDYAESNNLVSCPLCGRNFASNDKLIRSINKKFRRYVVYSDSEPCDIINDIFDNLLLASKNAKSEIISNLFDEITDSPSFRDKIKVVLKYKHLCDENNKQMSIIISSLPLQDSTVLKIVKTYNNNKTIIENNRHTRTVNTKILNYIIKEFVDITNLDDSLFSKNYDDLSLSFADKTTNAAIYELLSESECKRLSLSVLRAKLRYCNHKYLILDDPIDSYDDYYLSIVCTYIADILKEPKLDAFYLFTNNNDALLKLSSRLKCDSIVFYENPDIVYCGTSIVPPNGNDTLSLVASHDEIEFINKSEINLLYSYFCGKSSLAEKRHFDLDLSFIAFLPTVRNIKAEVVNKLNKSKLFGRGVDKTANFKSDVKQTIEHCFMHFDPDSSKIKNSLTVEVKDAFATYNYLIGPYDPSLVSYSTDSSSLNMKRLSECSKTFNSHGGTKLLNLIFKKIIFVSQIKYDFERIVLDKLENKFSFSSTDIIAIANTNNGFGSKIKKAKNLDRNNYANIASGFLQDVEKIHSKHREFVNQFDHALALMFPPYLSTRIYDIKKYKDDVDSLDNKY